MSGVTLEAINKLQSLAMRGIKRLADELYATDVHFFFVSPVFLSLAF